VEGAEELVGSWSSLPVHHLHHDLLGAGLVSGDGARGKEAGCCRVGNVSVRTEERENSEKGERWDLDLTDAKHRLPWIATTGGNRLFCLFIIY
jgi:hypothetical protein